MQISKSLKKCKRASIHINKRLTIIFALALLLVVILPISLHYFPQVTVSGDNPSPTSTPAPINTDESTGGGTGGPLYVTPEYGVSGAIFALVICFAAFAVYTKRGKVLSRN